MAEIVCTPICSECHSIINYVNYEYEYDPNSAIFNIAENKQKIGMKRISEYIVNHKRLTPYQCLRCGATFEKIVVPTKLPIDTSKLLGY